MNSQPRYVVTSVNILERVYANTEPHKIVERLTLTYISNQDMQ